jgi:tetratricopeptide (TPR) repeat protein
MSTQGENDEEIQRSRDAVVAGRDVHFFSAGDGDQLIAGVSRAILRPPIGRLPEVVRGRDRLLDLLSALVDQPDGRVHALVGVGGTGKSTIALAIAERAVRFGRDVWWVTVSDPVTVNSSLLALASHLGAQPEEVEAALLGEVSSSDLLWDRLEARPGWVLVLDRADDPRALSVGGRPVSDGRGWIRGSKSGLLLVTTRNGDPRAWGRSVELHQVGWLNDLDGASLLTDLAADSGTLEEAERLSASLGGLPLALQMAGAYLAQNHSTFENYERRIEGSIAEEHSDRQVVSRTFELSLEVLDRDGKQGARKLLESLCWFAAGTPVPAGRLDSGLLHELRLMALIDGQAEAADRIGEWIVLHPLVSESFRRILTERGRDREAAAEAVDLLHAQTADLTPSDKQQWYAWLPHLDSLLALAVGRLEPHQLAELYGIAGQLAQALSWAGDHARAEALAGSALAEARRLGPDSVAVIGLNLARATAFQVGGDYPRAEALIRDIVPILDRLLGPDHPDSQSARFDLARVVAAQGRLQEAEALLRQVLVDQQRILGPEHPRVLWTMSGLADVVMRQNRYEESEALLSQLYETQARVLGPDHPDTIQTLQRLGEVNALTGQYARANMLLRMSGDRASAILGATHPVTLEATYTLARVLADQGERAEAEALLRDLLTVQKQVLGPQDPAVSRTADTLRALGSETGRGPASEE